MPYHANQTSFKNGQHASLTTEFKRGRVCFWKGKKRPEEANEKQREKMKGRVPWNKDKKTGPLPEVWRRNISEGNKGKQRTAITKGRISKAKIGVARPDIRGDLSPTRRLEVREKIRARRLLQILPKKDTSIERAIQSELELRGIACYRNASVAGCCQPDFSFPEAKVAVFADGDYWHGRPGVKEKDERVNAVLREQSWRVLRFSETKINANLTSVVDEIIGRLNG